MANTPEAALDAYVTAFASLDVDAVVPFYHEPCLFVAPQGVTLAASRETSRQIASFLIEHARSQGYKRTRIESLRAQPLGDESAFLSGTFERLGAEDQPIGRFGFAYLMQRSGESWQIVAAVAYPAG